MPLDRAGSRRRLAPWTAALGLAGVSIALQATSPAVHRALRFDRDAILAGELWRILTGHLLHLGWTHCLLNLTGLILCAVIAPSLFRTTISTWRTVLTMASAISLAMLAFHPEIPDYVGLSGVLYGLFVMGLLPSAMRRDWLAAGCLSFIVARMIWQLAVGASADEERLIGGHVVGVAHAYGCAAGLVLLALGRWRRGRAAPPADSSPI